MRKHIMEQKIDERLEKAAEEYAYARGCSQVSEHFLSDTARDILAREALFDNSELTNAFIAGAKWFYTQLNVAKECSNYEQKYKEALARAKKEE